LIYLKVFRIRQVSGALFALLFNIITWTAVLLLLSLQFQLVENLSPLEAGLRIIPFEIAFLAVGPLSGRLADKYGQAQFTLSRFNVKHGGFVSFLDNGCGHALLDFERLHGAAGRGHRLVCGA
jgi:MFS family permease